MTSRESDGKVAQGKVVTQHQLMIESKAAHHRSSHTARAVYHSGAVHALYRVQLAHFVRHLLQTETRKVHTSLSGLTMCVVARLPIIVPIVMAMSLCISLRLICSGYLESHRATHYPLISCISYTSHISRSSLCSRVVTYLVQLLARVL